MSICSVCGGTVSGEDRECPFCGQTNPGYGLPAPGPAQDWLLLEDDTTPTLSTPAEPFAVGGDAPTASHEWGFLDEDLATEAETLSAWPVPAPAPAPVPQTPPATEPFDFP